jgi:peptide/nickel transport system permease protein
MRITDATLSFPVVLFALLLAVTMGAGMSTLIIGICLIIWARFARVMRGEALVIRDRDFVAQARVYGSSTLRIMVIQILPNVLNTLLVMLSMQVGWLIITEATLSFLGAGVPPPTPTWGQMVSEGRNYLTLAWWISFFPGAAIALVVLAFNLAGDWLRDRLDPKLREL